MMKTGWGNVTDNEVKAGRYSTAEPTIRVGNITLKYAVV